MFSLDYYTIYSTEFECKIILIMIFINFLAANFVSFVFFSFKNDITPGLKKKKRSKFVLFSLIYENVKKMYYRLFLRWCNT